MHSAIESLLTRYNPQTPQDFENALKEIFQELTLAGLSRSNFFDRAAFYGGTALRIFYGLPRFSEDLDFTLLSLQPDFSLKNYFNSVIQTFNSFGFEVEIEGTEKKIRTDVESAFIKTNTKMLFLKISSAQKFANKIQSNQKTTIKFEIDTTPPLGFETEVKYLPPPITSSVKIVKLPYLFSGKLHAILFRKWKNRVKGRDYYDLLWYLGKKVPFNLQYVENKIRDGGVWKEERKMTRDDVLFLLKEKMDKVDFQSAKQDVIQFIKNPQEVAIWNAELFQTALEQITAE